VGKSVESLSADERVAYYRGMASEALRLAMEAAEEQKARLIDTAAHWLTLAIEVERFHRESVPLPEALNIAEPKFQATD
jgi:hypothetical protein